MLDIVVKPKSSCVSSAVFLTTSQHMQIKSALNYGEVASLPFLVAALFGTFTFPYVSFYCNDLVGKIGFVTTFVGQVVQSTKIDLEFEQLSISEVSIIIN